MLLYDLLGLATLIGGAALVSVIIFDRFSELSAIIGVSTLIFVAMLLIFFGIYTMIAGIYTLGIGERFIIGVIIGTAFAMLKQQN